MSDEPLAREREPIERVRARFEALVMANAAPRCGARSKRTRLGRGFFLADAGSWSDQVAEAARDPTERPQAHSDDASSHFWRRRTARSPLYDQPIWMVRESRGGAVPGVR